MAVAPFRTMAGLSFGTHRCSCSHPHGRPRLVALTGGPGAGKTAVLELALRSLCGHVAVLPEAAAVVFGGGFPRRASVAARKAAQRAIFHVEREAERLVLEEAEVTVALCDRGTLDGAAYWPGPPADLFGSVGTTLEAELARYAAVIHLRTPAEGAGYNHDNALRVESASEARAIDERIFAVWSAHPHRLVVESTVDFIEKARRALQLVRAELPPCCRSAVL
jgi:hypothetical protein